MNWDIQTFRNNAIYGYVIILFILFTTAPAAIAGSVPHTFQSGEIVSASEFNENFDYLSERSWELTNDDLYYDSGGYIGIGTTTPEFLLDMTDSARIGMTEIGIWPADTTYAFFGHETLDHSIPGNYALLQSYLGSTYLNSASGRAIRFREDNVDRMIIRQGNVGIGTATPEFLLDMTDSARIGKTEIGIWPANATYAFFGHETLDHAVPGNYALLQSYLGSTYLNSASGRAIYFRENNLDRMIIRQGNVGIGTADPSYPLELASGAHVTAGGVWTNASSKDLKENISALSPQQALAAFKSLKPVKFNYKVDKEEKHLGFIAEDVPDILSTKDRKSLSTMDFVALLTKIVQEQQKTIAELSKRVDALESGVFNDKTIHYSLR